MDYYKKVVESTSAIENRNSSVNSIRSLVRGWFGNGAKTESLRYYKNHLAPSDVRYALQYKDGQFDASNIESLINNNFPDQANYLLLKGLAGDPLKQGEYLQQYVKAELRGGVAENEVHKLQLDAVHSLREQHIPLIPAKKLGKIFVQGDRLWSDRFQEIAQQVEDDPLHPTPVYLAYAGVMGLRQGIDIFNKDKREMMLLIPDWIASEEQELAGYSIVPDANNDQPVRFLPKSFLRPIQAIFIDDTVSTSAHANKAWDFWSRSEGQPLPADRLKVVYQTPAA